MMHRPLFSRVSTLVRLAGLAALSALALPGCSPADGSASSESRPAGADLRGSEEVGGGSAPGTFPVNVEDASGSVLVFQTPPTRIVSLVPSATRTLQALGAQGLLVARTVHDTGSALAHLPSVGGGLDPSLETLVALEPDLVIRFAGVSDRSTPSRLDDMGIRHLAIRLDRVADVGTMVGELGAITGLVDPAAKLVEEMDATLEEIRQRVKGRPRVRVAYILGGNPPWVAGPGTFIDELLTTAGGENAFSDLEALYGPVSPEEFLVREFDLLLAPEGAEVVLPMARVPLMRVSSALELPGPDLAQAAWHLAAILHPEVFR
ncbi:MAG: helical backbone metal receptor [Gemmatimonadota bacterium]